MKSNCKNKRVGTWAWFAVLVLGVAFPLLAVSDELLIRKGEQDLPDLVPGKDVVVVSEPSPSTRPIFSFDPHVTLYEAHQAVMIDELRRLLARFPSRIDPASRDSLAELLVDEGNRTGLDPIFLAAVIRVESAFFSGAVSNKGARGLMQLMPATAQELARQLGMHWQGPQQLHDLEINVRLGTIYLKQLLELYNGNRRLALTAYNRGPHNVRAIIRRHGRLEPRFTNYWRRIHGFYRRYRRILRQRDPRPLRHLS